MKNEEVSKLSVYVFKCHLHTGFMLHVNLQIFLTWLMFFLFTVLEWKCVGCAGSPCGCSLMSHMSLSALNVGTKH